MPDLLNLSSGDKFLVFQDSYLNIQGGLSPKYLTYVGLSPFKKNAVFTALVAMQVLDLVGNMCCRTRDNGVWYKKVPVHVKHAVGCCMWLCMHAEGRRPWDRVWETLKRITQCARGRCKKDFEVRDTEKD